MNIKNALSNEIKLPDKSAIANVIDWLFEGLRKVVPSAWHEIYWRPFERELAIANDYTIEDRISYRSALRAKRTITTGPDVSIADLPTVIKLPSSAVFRQSINLPREMSASFKETVALRLATLSPIEPKDALFDARKRENANANPKDDASELNIEVAISSKRHIDDFRHATKSLVHPSSPFVRYGIDHAETDTPGFTFYTDEVKHTPIWKKQSFLFNAALVASIVFATASFSIHQARTLQSLTAHQEVLHTDLKFYTQQIPKLDVDRNFDYSPAEAMLELSRQIGTIPAGVVIEELSITPGSTKIRALAPVEAKLQINDSVIVEQSLSNRPGYNSIQLNWQNDEGDRGNDK